MSHEEYIAGCDAEQLRSLVVMANERMKEIQQSGWVNLWVVSDEWCNRCWFSEDQHREAFDKMIEFASADYKSGESITWSVEKTRMRPVEAAEVLRIQVPMEKP